ncbi:MAG: asparaginase [Candidatus Delongbacteria bacterium]|nr:asparaginase [Candidatus Delongbacteria bacterium]MCG2760133.1 asparaginase [Candidatus Delongbacteria bacterium]
MKKKILIITTGGTISMKGSADGVVPSLTGKEILLLIPEIDTIADLTLYEFSNIPSPMMTPLKMFELSNIVTKMIDGFDGVVITHGTDTIEETSYMLFLTLQTKKPVIFTAAMRSNEETGLDGPRNLFNAIRVAANENSFDRGVMLAVNDEIFSVREVYKSSTSLTNAFDAPHYGILGMIDVDDIIFYRKSEFRYKFSVEKIETNVDMIKLCAGMSRKFIDYSVQTGAKGIVVEAFGRGNVNPEMQYGIIDAMEKGIPVVITSRVPNGRVLGIYGYEGGAKRLEENGAIMGYDLNGEKARLKLMVLLGLNKSVDEIRQIFKEDKG